MGFRKGDRVRITKPFGVLPVGAEGKVVKPQHGMLPHRSIVDFGGIAGIGRFAVHRDYLEKVKQGRS